MTCERRLLLLSFHHEQQDNERLSLSIAKLRAKPIAAFIHVRGNFGVKTIIRRANLFVGV
jgi:hypothetical protein